MISLILIIIILTIPIAYFSYLFIYLEIICRIQKKNFIKNISQKLKLKLKDSIISGKINKCEIKLCFHPEDSIKIFFLNIKKNNIKNIDLNIDNKQIFEINKIITGDINFDKYFQVESNDIRRTIAVLSKQTRTVIKKIMKKQTLRIQYDKLVFLCSKFNISFIKNKIDEMTKLCNLLYNNQPTDKLLKNNILTEKNKNIVLKNMEMLLLTINLSKHNEFLKKIINQSDKTSSGSISLRIIASNSFFLSMLSISPSPNY